MKTMLQRIRNKKGFTLAELLIVVAIIAVLVAIAIPVFGSSMEKAEIATDKANVRAAYAEAVVAHLETINEENPTTITATVLAGHATNGHVTTITGGKITFSDGANISYKEAVVTGTHGT